MEKGIELWADGLVSLPAEPTLERGYLVRHTAGEAVFYPAGLKISLTS